MTSQIDRVADMTKDELRSLIRETFEELLWEYEQEFDPDEGLEFKPEIAKRLRAALQQRPRRGTPADEVKRELGLEE
jgi:hypothetical protein